MTDGDGLADRDPFAAPTGAPDWMITLAGLIRPLCVGALLAIPTFGAASVGVVAFFSRNRAMNMVDASTAFLRGMPTDVILLIGTLATGYGIARSVEKLRRKPAEEPNP